MRLRAKSWPDQSEEVLDWSGELCLHFWSVALRIGCYGRGSLGLSACLYQRFLLSCARRGCSNTIELVTMECGPLEL